MTVPTRINVFRLRLIIDLNYTLYLLIFKYCLIQLNCQYCLVFLKLITFFYQLTLVARYVGMFFIKILDIFTVIKFMIVTISE